METWEGVPSGRSLVLLAFIADSTGWLATSPDSDIWGNGASPRSSSTRDVEARRSWRCIDKWRDKGTAGLKPLVGELSLDLDRLAE